ncbi:hypothetical protein EWE75_21140 [Sphingomonas populi]|uniref:Uncharacterized protein n=1 Tax=Sphingomonas populi TaxID=2484750 RepID=A0A4V2DCA6_9SPHN|nr:hypothetical protein EWE75_21140 [Sphingomonas populi]
MAEVVSCRHATRSASLKHERAGVLARSGNYAGWQEVEAALLQEGHTVAKTALQSQYLRDLLTDHCIEARGNG